MPSLPSPAHPEEASSSTRPLPRNPRLTCLPLAPGEEEDWPIRHRQVVAQELFAGTQWEEEAMRPDPEGVIRRIEREIASYGDRPGPDGMRRLESLNLELAEVREYLEELNRRDLEFTDLKATFQGPWSLAANTVGTLLLVQGDRIALASVMNAGKSLLYTFPGGKPEEQGSVRLVACAPVEPAWVYPRLSWALMTGRVLLMTTPPPPPPKAAR